MIEITPTNRTWWIRIRLQSPLSHHDPDVTSKSNRQVFRRVAKLISKSDIPGIDGQKQIDEITQAYPVPADIADIFAEITLSQFMGVAIFYEFIARYSGGEGSGLMEGVDRYRRLEERVRQAAIQSNSFIELWGIACDSLQLPHTGGNRDSRLGRLFACPASAASQALKVLAESPRSLVVIARLWNETEKQRDANYAKKSGTPQTSGGMVTLSPKGESDSVAATVVELPALSANTIRHEMIREPGMWHLYNSLGLAFDEPPAAATSMFYNGGDIKSGASQPANVFFLRKTIREHYPLLALLSGSTDSFLVGEGNIRVHSWVRCVENNDALGPVGLLSSTSVFEMLDDWTLTRHSGRLESGQMPFSFETLAENTEIAVRLSVTPYADKLQIGALMAALSAFEECDSTVGGQSARGFGLTTMNWHDCQLDTGALVAYQEYIDGNRDLLRSGVLDGTLCTGKKILS